MIVNKNLIVDLLSRQTTDKNGRKAKQEISTWTLIGKKQNVEPENDGDKSGNRVVRYNHQRIANGTFFLGRELRLSSVYSLEDLPNVHPIGRYGKKVSN